MKSLTVWSKDDRLIEAGQKAPFDGVIMTKEAYTKTFEELEACDIYKKHFDGRKDIGCEPEEEKRSNWYWFFVTGLLSGVIIGTAAR